MLDAVEAKSQAIVEQWLARLEEQLSVPGPSDLSSLFMAESYWRDVLALTWSITTLSGSEKIAKSLSQQWQAAGVTSCRIEEASLPPREVVRVGREAIEACFIFETKIGRGRGLVRLRPDDDSGGQYKVWTLLTALDELKGFPETAGKNRPTGQSHSRDFRGPNWLDDRVRALAYEDRDPAVLVVGGGQAGLAIAARLTQLGVDTLIVDRHERIGDNWRKRYHALTLHNQVQVNHMPYVPFPPTWPTYIPKDKLANWFEAYVEALELNYWTSTELLGATYSDAANCWTATLKGSDGAQRLLRPHHIVMATGVSGIPNRPGIAGLEDFKGLVVHSSEYQDGEDWTGKNAIVIGTGNSGHDIAQDLSSSGAAVTLVQRSPTLVVNIEPSAQLPYALYDEGPALEDCDFITSSVPTPLAREAHVDFTRRSAELDKELLDGLKQIGFKLDFGDDGTGWQFKYLTRGGGYYFNVGCSDMLVEGKIRLAQFADLDCFVADGARLKCGDLLPADLVVLATGYMPQEHLVTLLFGADVAKRVGPIWGFGEGLELRNMYCRTGQPGLYFIAGSLAQCRINSKYLALQIKALEEQLIKPR